MEASTLGAKWRLADENEDSSGSGGRFSWGQQAAQFQHLEAFKEAMVKDREVIALVGALMMTISFSYMVAENGRECPREVELLGLLAQSLAAVLSSLSTLVALHGVLLINTSSCEQTVALLQSVHEARWWKKAHPFNTLMWSIGGIAAATTIRVGCTHGLHGGEFATFAILLAGAICVWLHEASIHRQARREQETA
jgi:hypothetical protein